MRLAVLLALILATFVANSAVGFISAEDTTNLSSNHNKNNDKRIAVDKIIKRLRTSQAEERGIVPVMLVSAAARVNRADSTSTQSIVHAVKQQKPIPKWATALTVVLGLGVLAGLTYGNIVSINLAQSES
ncbi:hypothetical protein PF002_g4877 [Phytophthora fragariae]|uniref:RxLR effector protein n=1 Tax=Phytophthora fragariae TaxID=53985 RepID=A0A6A3EIR9_9STRA|nr:hypothetical protein PF009_g16475 [Phytophthora fragariae]KAE8992126.1 hypothetical protein PF011_g17667 [Phytophthora fragariae]KAE9117575.1 hypothetical protein PF006_g18785 [Phytophthora fragariae]KAE9250258.1 hypothetical protein PF002_g4877 [Phytophthora fragariae]